MYKYCMFDLDNCMDSLQIRYGKHFSPSTGIFNDPREGIYEFFTATEYILGNANILSVEKNNVKELELFKQDDYESPLNRS